MPRKKVSFIAKQTIKESRIVRFSTKQGKVSFKAKVEVTKPVKVNFTAKKIEKKK